MPVPPARTALATAAALVTLLAPVPPPAAAAPVRTVVQPGQTLAGIARAHGLTTDELAASNGVPRGSAVQPDALLRLTAPPRPAPAFRASAVRISAAALGATYRPGCPVRPAALRAVRLTHWTFAGTAATGELVVHADLVDESVAVFRQLYAWRFPIAKMVPASAYGGSDDASMADNSTSAYNCRRRTGGSGFSEHSYGRAVDVNPVQNPYVRGATVLPPAGRAHVDRRAYLTGRLHARGAVRAFSAQDLVWGGTWRSLKDYQHFSSTGR